MRKAQVLIITIMIMLFLALLAWTVVNFSAADLQSSSRVLSSERAFYIAEGGLEWAVKQWALNSSWRTSATPDTDCDDGDDWQTISSSFGQCQVCARNSTVAEGGQVAIEVEACVPNINNCSAKRVVLLILGGGDFTQCVFVSDDFDWTNLDAAFNIWVFDYMSRINGHITAENYDRDGDGTPNENGTDYFPPNDAWGWLTNWLLVRPPVSRPYAQGNSPPTSFYQRNVGVSGGSFPTIKMQWFYDNATDIWPPTDRVVGLQTTITAISSQGPNWNIDTGVDNFFTDMRDEFIRNVTVGGWNDDSLEEISNVPMPQNGRRARVSDINGDGVCSPRVGNEWCVGDTIELVKRFEGNSNSKETWYVDGDAVFDAMAGSVSFSRKCIVVVGDTRVLGPNSVSLSADVSGTTTLPILATKVGDIISTETPNGATEFAKRDNRDFDGLIYSESGSIEMHYLNGIAVYGEDVKLEDVMELNYDSTYLNFPSGCFESITSWQEN